MSLLDHLARHLPLSWRSESSILRHRAIPDALWAQTLAHYPFLAWRSLEQQQRLRALSTLFLARKRFVPAGGLEISDEMAVAIAAQACLPVLRLGLGAYAHMGHIVVHPDQVVAHREVMDEAGVVHQYDEVLAGEAMPDGPVMLSWHDVQQARNLEHGYNVVVHEFAHALDMIGGELNGTPPLPADISKAQWQDVMWQGFDRHSEALARGEDTWLDPYAAEAGLVEFFPVVTEAFFVAPWALRADFADVYALLARFFGEDPAALIASGGTTPEHLDRRISPGALKA
ncbi:zinc-dependent peptidase [Aquabacterium soli]|uniref:Zinc-dependent peptidase n=1 Tax=Aquabacterium soli TaxID=2493092 RepID=A0A3R8YPZ9_9BURK|nr:M90 family metallopeptidase [Aquabacterium soli]RRS05384.1 zinc-dependent peptidase [Aquabacterium soli]